LSTRKAELKKGIGAKIDEPPVSPEIQSGIQKYRAELGDKFYEYLHYPIINTKVIIAPASFIPYVDGAGNNRRDPRPAVYAIFQNGRFRLTESFAKKHGMKIDDMAKLFEDNGSFGNGLYLYESWDTKPTENSQFWKDRVTVAAKTHGVRTVVKTTTGSRATGDSTKA